MGGSQCSFCVQVMRGCVGIAAILCYFFPGGVGGGRSAPDGYPLWLQEVGSWSLRSWSLGGYIGVLPVLAP